MYAIFFTLLVLGGFLTNKSFGKLYFFFMLLILLAIIGLRSPQVGTDTPIYIRGFERMASLSFDACWHRMQEVREPLYIFMTWLVRSFVSSYVIYLLFWALFPCAAIWFTLKDELKSAQDYMVALLCLFALGFYAFFVAGIRQTAAISFVFFSYRFLKKIDITYKLKSYLTWNSLKFALCAIAAYLLHNSVIIFLCAIPFLKMKIRWWYLPAVISLFFVSSFVTIQFLVQVSSFIFPDRFSSYGTTYNSALTINGFIMQFILFLMCFFRYVKLQEKDKSNVYLFNLVMVGLVFQSLTGMIAEMWRVSFYFSIFFLILVPRAIKEYKPIVRAMMYPSFTLLVLLYLFGLSRSQLPEYSSSIF